MLADLGVGWEELLGQALPAAIRDSALPGLPDPESEPEVLAALRRLAGRNTPMVQMIGAGYYDTFTPAVIRRGVLSNPAWYTAYTPYQAEVAQGRLELLMLFQTMVEDLTALPIANASLLDEPTAAAEAMAIAVRADRAGRRRFLVDHDVLPQTRAVLATRAEPVGIEIVDHDLAGGLPPWAADRDRGACGVLISDPAASGAVRDWAPLASAAHAAGCLVVATTDLLALLLLRPPGAWGADIAVGSAQRFGVPLGYGGPHAGFIAVRTGLERQLPGRLVGASVDSRGRPAYRLALQTREQHIRRERATSNICTAQALLAIVAALYAAHHGPTGLRQIAERVHHHARRLAAGLQAAGLDVAAGPFFDTVSVESGSRTAAFIAAARRRGINVRAVDDTRVAVSTDEVTTSAHIDALLAAAAEVMPGTTTPASPGASQTAEPGFGVCTRSGPAPLAHPHFHRHRSETSMMRWLRHLADRDLALDRAMIPLGSCTMKLTAAAEMEAILWPEFAGIHPFAPLDQAAGWQEIIGDLERWLAAITGYDAVSLQPNSGSQGEYAGLLAIRAYHRSRGDRERTVCLIPSSAHGTNAASAAMAGMDVVVVDCDARGDVDLDDLRTKAAEHRARLAAIMVTFPSTHGVYEEGIGEICAIVHEHGGQVYVDGANLNALVGLARPGQFGADVSHVNLHKTFCIPHGGGGPGVGPIGVRAHLAPFLPGHPLRPGSPGEPVVGPVNGAPWGSAGVLPIPWAYLRLMGAEGLRRATAQAVLSANWIAARLAPHYPILYTGRTGRVAHECIVDIRPLTAQTGVTVDDIAKRLMDYGFHAPTVSFPVAGTIMIEPTESEERAELDRFLEALIAIRGEIAAVADGTWSLADSPLRRAPHTVADVAGTWDRPYSRELAVLPSPAQQAWKYWPPVNRIDAAHGDRTLICSCVPVAEYAAPTAGLRGPGGAGAMAEAAAPEPILT